MGGKRSLVYGVGINDWVGNVMVDGKWFGTSMSPHQNPHLII